MPLRDERRGRRATIGTGTTPLRAEFSPTRPTAAIAPAEAAPDLRTEDAFREDECAVSPAADAEFDSAARERSGSAASTSSGMPSRATASDANQRRSLLEPSAVLMALLQPLIALRSACVRLMQLPIAPNDDERGTRDAPELHPTGSETSQRSFASEVASLLQLPIAAPRAERSTNAVPLEERPADAAPLEERPDTGGTLDGFASEIEPEDSVKAYDGGDVPLESDSSGAEGGIRQSIVVASLAVRAERVVPLTRLPLRPQGLAITWTADVPELADSGTCSRAERHALLERFIRDPANVPSEVIARAYHEEDGEGRTLALRVLLRHPHAGRSAFVEALRVGSDDERTLAVDGLTAIGARDALALALADRVDAIAAKAALSYVGTLARADYRVELGPFIDEKQIDTILALLAGIVE